MRVIFPQHRQIASNIMDNAEKMLKKGRLGGVTKKSAQAAVDYSVESAVAYGDKIKDYATISHTAEESKLAVEGIKYRVQMFLEKRFLGGYTKESAKSAIKAGVIEAVISAERAVDKAKEAAAKMKGIITQK